MTSRKSDRDINFKNPMIIINNKKISKNYSKNLKNYTTGNSSENLVTGREDD